MSESKQKKVSRRDFLRVTTTTATGVLLAACGAVTAPDVGTTGGTDASSVPAPAAEAPAPGKVVLRLHERTIPYKVEYWKELGAKFAETHPNVELKVEADGVGNPYNEKMLTSLAGGTIGDMFWLVDVENYDTFRAKGVLAPLDPFIEADGYDLSQYLPNVIDFYKRDGKQYILPTGVHNGPENLFYNRDMFEAAGLPTPQSPDWTWDEFAETATRLTNADEKVFGANIPVGWSEAQIVVARSYGGDILDKEGKTSTLLTEPTVAAFNLMSDLINERKANPRPAEIMEGGANKMFAAGKLGMYMSGPWDVYVLRELIAENSLNWDMTLVPKGPAGRKGQLVSEGYAVPTTSKNQQLAWEFIKLMCSPEEGVARIAKGFISPPRKDAILDPKLMEDPMYAMYADELVNNTAASPTLPHNARTSEFFQLLITGFDSIWLGKGSVQDTLTEVDRQLTALLAKPLP